MMKAAILSAYGGPEVFRIQEREIPVPGEHEVLIEVKAAGINRPDVFQRRGKYPAPNGAVQDILGLEVSGIVRKIGANVERIQIGDQVMALLSGGGYAAYVCADSGSCILKPSMLSFQQAASLPETVFTVWHNLFERGGLKSGDKVLIQGGSGGIGSVAIQLANLFGAEVITTIGDDFKKKYVEDLGANLIINYKKEDFEQVLIDFGVNLVLDCIGGDYFPKHINILKEDGRLVQINAIKSRMAELDVFKMMQKRITVTGSTLRSRDITFKSALRAQVETHVIPLLLSGEFKPIVTKTFPLIDVSKAHEYFDSSEFYGKIILLM